MHGDQREEFRWPNEFFLKAEQTQGSTILYRAHPTKQTADVRFGSIWLQKSLAVFVNRYSVTLMRFAKDAIDDGAAQSRSKAILLFI
jgi:hypothetical protein